MKANPKKRGVPFLGLPEGSRSRDGMSLRKEQDDDEDDDDDDGDVRAVFFSSGSCYS